MATITIEASDTLAKLLGGYKLTLKQIGQLQSAPGIQTSAQDADGNTIVSEGPDRLAAQLIVDLAE